MTANATTAEPTQGGCEERWNLYEDQCYQIHGFNGVGVLSWNDAKSQCRSHGGYLATILTPDAQAFLTAGMEFEFTDVWIGLSNTDPDRTFRWESDNSNVDFESWGRQQPDGYPNGGDHPPTCVVMMSTRTEAGDWNDQNCSRELPYYCQKPIDPTRTSPPDIISLCNADYESYFQSCFKFYPAPKTFSDAEGVCVAEGTHLASITDAYEEAYLESVLYKEQLESAWIGLQILNQSDTYEWTNGWPVYYTLWGSGEPSGGPGEGCVEATTGRNWDDTNCSKEQPFMCKYTDVSRPTTPPTSVGYCLNGWVEFGSYCYLFTTQSTATFADAKSACASNNGTLLTVHNTAENVFLLEQTTSDGSLVGDMWLGVTKNEEDGYEYLDGEPVNFVDWATGEPHTGTDDCVVMQTDVYGHWAAANCLGLFAYGCKREKGLSPGQITGIVLGVIGFILLVGTLAVLIFCSRKQIIPREQFSNERDVSYENNKAL
ncbi:macrophage mannose receptor 1-like [Diadema antillarum]|uniref:macrophage mannose receptor 1-like n=1 Tax=Diadema antillarum TaxID=105358 RepID=UPI003A8A08FE